MATWTRNGLAWDARWRRLRARTAAAVALAVVVALPALAAGSARADTTTSISGTIRDSSGAAITSSGICVQAQAAGGGNGLASAITDADGTYDITALTPGSYDVYAFDCGDTSSRDDVPGYYTSGAAAVAAAVTVTSGQTVSNIDVRLAAGTSISGTVYGGPGTATALGGVCVSATPTDGVSQSGGSTSGSDGAYTIDHILPDVSYDLEFWQCSSSAAYAPEFYNGKTTFAAADAVTPTSRALTAIDAHLQPGASIRGTIRDANGSPIVTQDVCVTAFSAQPGLFTGTATTDADGSYEITGLDAGSYDVQARDCENSSRHDAPGEYSVSPGSRATAIGVTAGQQVSDKDITLAPGTSISGHVYGGDGRSTPLAGASVDVIDAATGDWVAEASTDTDGSYTIDHLVPGDGYKVQFTPSAAESTFVSQYYGDASTPADATVLWPTVDTPSAEIDAHLAPAGSISGTVYGADERPVTSQDVCANAFAYGSGGGGGHAATDAGGNYTITGLPAGSYYVEFADCPNSKRNDVEQFLGGAHNETSSQLVPLSSGGAATGNDAHLAHATSISGHVYALSAGGALAHICVSASAASQSAQDGSYFYNASSDATGAYEIDHVAPLDGGYTVRFSDCNNTAKYVTQYYGGDYDLSSATVVTPTLDAQSSGIDARLSDGATISGTVSGTDGNPVVSGICIMAEMGSWPSSYSQFTSTLSAGGGYTLGGLPAGTYSLSFTDCGSRNDVPLTVSDVTVTAGQLTGAVNATLKQATSISGRVYLGDGPGSPASGICVEVLNSDGSQVAGVGTFTRTAGDGSYAFDHLDPSGHYVVAFNMCWGGSGAGQYDGDATSLTGAIVLTPTATAPTTGIDAHLSSGPPVSTITSGPAANAQTNQIEAVFTFSANAAQATFECRLDNGA